MTGRPRCPITGCTLTWIPAEYPLPEVHEIVTSLAGLREHMAKSHSPGELADITVFCLAEATHRRHIDAVIAQRKEREPK